MNKHDSSAIAFANLCCVFGMVHFYFIRKLFIRLHKNVVHWISLLPDHSVISEASIILPVTGDKFSISRSALASSC